MAAFTPGSVSLRLYPHLELAAPEIVEELRAQAVLAAEHGFAGVMTSEHHGGFGGYLPNPLQLAGWLLEAMPRGWAAPCPLLLPLRPAALVAEETAWLAARFPDRVGLGVAARANLGDLLMNANPITIICAQLGEVDPGDGTLCPTLQAIVNLIPQSILDQLLGLGSGTTAAAASSPTTASAADQSSPTLVPGLDSVIDNLSGMLAVD